VHSKIGLWPFWIVAGMWTLRLLRPPAGAEKISVSIYSLNFSVHQSNSWDGYIKESF